jgi:CubicO group peptidase (beta-lactamase class C family)
MAAIPRHWRGAFPAWGPLGSTLLWRRLRPGVCVVVSLVLGASQPVEGAQTPSRALVDSVFGEFDDQTPGAAIAVVHDARLVFAAGYGMANLDHDVPVGPETVFDIASVSKQFTGMAVSMLVEAGRIDLDAEARRYLPELPDFGDPLTVRHLVHHTSGIRDWPATLGVAGWRMDDVISFPQILRMAWNQRELNFPPGSEYSYSNTGYNLLAEIVSRVTGESFRAWTDQNIFRPLGMTSTHFQDDHREIVLRRAQGYTRVRGEWMVAPNSSAMPKTRSPTCWWVKAEPETCASSAPGSERVPCMANYFAQQSTPMYLAP